jgi:hypothetical protein
MILSSVTCSVLFENQNSNQIIRYLIIPSVPQHLPCPIPAPPPNISTSVPPPSSFLPYQDLGSLGQQHPPRTPPLVVTELEGTSQRIYGDALLITGGAPPSAEGCCGMQTLCRGRGGGSPAGIQGVAQFACEDGMNLGYMIIKDDVYRIADHTVPLLRFPPYFPIPRLPLKSAASAPPARYTITNAGATPTNANVNSCDLSSLSIPANAWSMST